MGRTLSIACLTLGLTGLMTASELQGVVVDWSCIKPMLKDGRPKTLRRKPNCSLMKDYNRAAYGLITNDEKSFRLDDPDNRKILKLLQGTPDKDNLKVIVTGDIQGEAVKVVNISLL